MASPPTDSQPNFGGLLHPGDCIRNDQLTINDVIFYPVDYSTESNPTIQLAIDDHQGSNRFQISLSLRRAEFILAHETGDFDTYEAIARDIVSTVCNEYKGRFLEVVSAQDGTYMELDQECESVKRVMISLHNLSQIPFCPPAASVNVCGDDEVDEEAGSVKLAFHNMFESSGTPSSDDRTPNSDFQLRAPQLEIGSSFESLPTFYDSFQPRADYLETQSILSSKSGTASNFSISYSSGKLESHSSGKRDSICHSSVKSVNTFDVEKPSSLTNFSSTESNGSRPAPAKKDSKESSPSTSSTKKGRKKRVIQRRGLMKFNNETSSKPKSKQRPSSKLNVDLGDSRFAIDPSLSQIVHKAASEGQSTEITELVTTNSYCESTTASEPQNRKRPGALRGLRSTWLKKLNVGKSNTKHYSTSEADILENDNRVKCLDDDAYRNLSSFDVLCQHEPHGLITSAIHIGNNRMKIMMQNQRKRFHVSNATKYSKQIIVNNLVTEVTDGVKGNGSFVAKESEDACWHELDRKMSCLMVEGTLNQCKHDPSILDLEDLSPSQRSQCDNFIGGRYHTALMNLKNRKKKKILSSKMNTDSIEDQQKRMIEATDR